MELHEMPNIGKVVEKALKEAGIHTPEELIETGSKDAFVRLRAMDASACLNRLCALEGAIQNVRWHHLDEAVKKDLKEFYQKLG